MPRSDRLSAYATTVKQEGDTLRVTYHSTDIVTASADQITLNMGGWDTDTTRRKMNQAARQFDLGYSIGRRKGENFVTTRDGLSIHRLDASTPLTLSRR